MLGFYSAATIVHACDVSESICAIFTSIVITFGVHRVCVCVRARMRAHGPPKKIGGLDIAHVRTLSSHIRTPLLNRIPTKMLINYEF